MKKTKGAPAARGRLRTAVESLPAGCSLTLSRELLLQVLSDRSEGDPIAEDPGALAADLTVPEIARLFGRSPNTVRQWLESGKLQGYKLLGREWRVTRSAVEAFQREQRESKRIAISPRRSTKSLSDWRKVG